MHFSRTFILSAALVATSTSAGCTRTGADTADDALDRDETASTQRPAAMQPATPPQTAMQPSSETPPVLPDAGPSQTDAALQLTDEQVFMMLSMMGDKEIELARLAQQRGRSKDVRSYAAMILAHGQEAKNQRLKLSQRTAFAPARSDSSQTIAMDGKAALQMLESASGEDFDKAFVKVMVDDKRAMLVFFDAVDDAVRSDALDDYIDDRKKIVESDLRATEALQSMLEESKPVPKPTRGPAPGPSGV